MLTIKAQEVLDESICVRKCSGCVCFLSFVERLSLHVSAVWFAEGARWISGGKVKGCRESSVGLCHICLSSSKLNAVSLALAFSSVMFT